MTTPGDFLPNFQTRTIGIMVLSKLARWVSELGPVLVPGGQQTQWLSN
jgi:hypothetical protein